MSPRGAGDDAAPEGDIAVGVTVSALVSPEPHAATRMAA